MKKTIKKKTASKRKTRKKSVELVKANYPPVAQKTYFYEHPNGKVFACNAKEAFMIHSKYKQIGVSSGMEYARIVSELQRRPRITREEAQKVMNQAIAAELKIAKGKLEAPPDTSLGTFGNNAVDSRSVLNLIGKR